MAHGQTNDSALLFASELGLRLSTDDDVESCQWHSSFPDSSGVIVVRTAPHRTRRERLSSKGQG